MPREGHRREQQESCAPAEPGSCRVDPGEPDRGHLHHERVLTRTHEAGVDYWYLAFAVASQAAGMLAQACGSKAQAVDLVDCWLNSAVRARTRAAQL